MSEKPTPTFSWDALDKQLEQRATRGSATRKSIKGGFTTREYAKEKNVTYQTAVQRIRRFRTSGFVKVIGQFQQVTMSADGGRKVAWVKVYDIVKGAKA